MWTCSLLALTLLAASPAQSESEDLQAYAQALEAARASSGEGSWRAADKAWSALLAEHAGHEHARAEVEEIRLALKRARFWARTSEPRLDEHISGKLVKHERSSGRIQVLYTPATLGDFSVEDLGQEKARLHPAHFAGPWSLEVEDEPQVVAGITWLVHRGERGVGLRAGLRREDDLVFSLHNAWSYAPEGQVELAQAEPKPIKASTKRMRLRLSVRERAIELEVDGRKVLEVPREGDDYGALGWIASTPPAQLELEGRADRGWLDGVRDAAVADAWGEFQAAWVDPPEFARWPTVESESPLELDVEALASRIGVRADFRAGQQEVFAQFQPHLGKGWAESKSVLKAVRELREGALPDTALAFLTYASAVDLGHFQEALDVAPRLVPLEGQEVPLGLLDSLLCERADRLDDALTRVAGLLETHPGESALHARRVDLLLRQGRLAEAREALDASRRSLPGSRRLLERERQVVRATLGPPWKRMDEHEGRYFVVRSEIGPKVCRDAAAVLDAAMERCQERLGPLPEGTPRATAYVFAGSRGYLEYVEDIADESLENTLGIYSPVLRQVAVWNQPDQAGLWNVLRHEAVHRYLDARAGSLPRWLDEGLAESISSEFLVDGGPQDGQVRREWVAVLRAQGGSVPPLQLFDYQDRAFDEAIERSYALAWAWLHVLRFVDPEGRAVFDALWSGVASGQDVAVALDAALAGRDVNALQARFVAYLNELLSGQGGR